MSRFITPRALRSAGLRRHSRGEATGLRGSAFQPLHVQPAASSALFLQGFVVFDESLFFFDCIGSLMVLYWKRYTLGFLQETNKFVRSCIIYQFSIIMAKVKYSALLSDMRGKLNGSVAARNRGGAYLRTKVTPLNPKTTDQVQARSLLANFSQAWRALDQEQRDAWMSVTDQWTKTNVFGDVVNPSGSTLYTRLNINIRLAGGVAITVPPTPQGVPSLSTLSVAAAFGDGTMLLTFAATPVPAGMVMYIEATPMLSPGINNANSKFRHVQTLPAATATGADIAAAYTAKFGELVEGQKFFVRAKMIRIATGEVSQVLSAFSIVAA